MCRVESSVISPLLQTYHLEESEMGSHHLENDSMEDNQPFPTLDLAFQTLDPHVGFNIEIKWTMQLEVGSVNTQELQAENF